MSEFNLASNEFADKVSAMDISEILSARATAREAIPNTVLGSPQRTSATAISLACTTELLRRDGQDPDEGSVLPAGVKGYGADDSGGYVENITDKDDSFGAAVLSE